MWWRSQESLCWCFLAMRVWHLRRRSAEANSETEQTNKQTVWRTSRLSGTWYCCKFLFITNFLLKRKDTQRWNNVNKHHNKFPSELFCCYHQEKQTRSQNSNSFLLLFLKTDSGFLGISSDAKDRSSSSDALCALFAFYLAVSASYWTNYRPAYAYKHINTSFIVIVANNIQNVALPVCRRIFFSKKRIIKHLVVGRADVETHMNRLAESQLFYISSL